MCRFRGWWWWWYILVVDWLFCGCIFCVVVVCSFGYCLFIGLYSGLGMCVCCIVGCWLLGWICCFSRYLCFLLCVVWLWWCCRWWCWLVVVCGFWLILWYFCWIWVVWWCCRLLGMFSCSGCLLGWMFWNNVCWCLLWFLFYGYLFSIVGFFWVWLVVYW